MSFADDVRSVLSDTMNLPPELLDYLIQYSAVNPVSSAARGGDLIASETHTPNVTSTGTTFATGTDILTSSLGFTAQGGNSYKLVVSGRDWSNSGTGNRNILRLNLDGADAGIFADATLDTASFPYPLMYQGVILTPAAGNHTINVRLCVTSGTATIDNGGGGAGTSTPLLVELYRI